MSKLLLLGASEIQIPSILKAKALGHHVLVADYNPEAPGLALADTALIVSTNDIESVLKIAQQHKINGIATTSDFPVRTVATVGQAMGLSTLPLIAAESCTDKYVQRELIKAAGLETPWFFLLKGEEELESKKVLSWPAIVKPVDSSASRGVSKVNSEQELAAAIMDARINSRSGRVIVEEFIEGPEFSVETLCGKGKIEIIAITEKTTEGNLGKYFVETRHVIPASISEKDNLAIRCAVEKAVIACKVENSGVHAELKLSSRGPILIEMAARLGGDQITSDLVPLATGVDMVEAVINMALGLPLSIKHTRSRFAGIQFITPANYEKAIQKIESIKAHPCLSRYLIQSKTSNVELKSSLDRLGYWIVAADTREELNSLLDF